MDWVEQAKHLVESGQMTQSEVAELFGVTRQAVSHHLSGAKLRRRVSSLTPEEREQRRARERERMRKYRAMKKEQQNAD